MLFRLLSQIKEKLSDHEGKLQEAQDLLHEAQGKTRQAGSMADQNQANLVALEVVIHSYLAANTSTNKFNTVMYVNAKCILFVSRY